MQRQEVLEREHGELDNRQRDWTLILALPLTVPMQLKLLCCSEPQLLYKVRLSYLGRMSQDKMSKNVCCIVPNCNRCSVEVRFLFHLMTELLLLKNYL